MIRAIKGTRDILPPSVSVWQHVEQTARDVFRAWNYQEIRTPIFEETALFARGVGEETDIVSKEMYTFPDRDETSLTLRPENTAGVMRAWIEHRLDQQPGVQKLFYIGPMFRRERPQKGRFRQFFQIGAEAIGSTSPALDAEVIAMIVRIFDRSGISGYNVIINSVGCPQCRPAYNAALRDQLASVKHLLSADNQRRADTNPLRVLDSKVPEDQQYVETLPSIHDFLCEDCRTHFAQVRMHLEDYGVPYTVSHRLVRGLDYYTRTTFEFTHGALGAQNSIIGGGRYDGLAEILGSKVPGPGIGFSIGEDRLVMAVEEALPGRFEHKADLYIAPMSLDDYRYCTPLACALREKNVVVELAAPAKFKKALEAANKTGARHALLVGEDERRAGVFTLRDMSSGEQHSLTQEQLVERFS
jgi:histidyl-tRNA synthetase